MKIQKVDAVIDQLPKVIAFIEEELKNAGCPDAQKVFVTMASEEIYVNIASYAYQGALGTVEISCEQTNDTTGIRICFTDRGIPFNPLLKAPPDTGLPALERQAGGLGIYMVKQFMDHVTYEYINGQNQLTIEKHW